MLNMNPEILDLSPLYECNDFTHYSVDQKLDEAPDENNFTCEDELNCHNCHRRRSICTLCTYDSWNIDFTV